MSMDPLDASLSMALNRVTEVRDDLGEVLESGFGRTARVETSVRAFML